jgi:PAS domain S-box-containing protein
MNLSELGFDFYIPHTYLKAALTVSLLTVWVLVGLFHYLNRYTRRRYFTIWTAAWLLYAVFLTLSISVQNAPDNLLLLTSKNWCVSTSGVFLLWGSFCFLKIRTSQRLMGGFVFFLLAWSYCASAEGNAALWLLAPTFFLLGGASLFTGWAYLRVRRRKELIGAGLLAFGFSLWGIYMVAYPFLQLSEHLVSMAFFVSAVLQLFIAVSMIVLVLEEVRATNNLNRQRLFEQRCRNQLWRSRVRSTEDRYKKLFEQASEAIIITSAHDLRVLELNDAARRLLGLPADSGEFSVRDFCPGNALGDNSADEWFEWIGQQPQVSLVRVDGSSVETEVSVSRISFDGKPAFQLFFRELTERARLLEQLRQAEKLSALGQMISGVSHELNNPLAAINGYVELILARHQLSSETRADLERVAQESSRAAKLIHDFLTFARQEPLERTTVDVNDIIQAVVELRKFEMRITGAELRLDLAKDELSVMGNRDQLQQVLINVVNNALHAVLDQEQKCLSISSRRIDNLVQIRVADNGPGIPAHVLTRIFEPFFTTKPVGGGTGLGLSIAHSIIGEHRGRIFHETPAAGGTAFIIELPAGESEHIMQERSDQPQKPFVSSARAAESARILILDDESSITELLGEMLRLLGYSAKLCNSPTRALELLDQEEFDVVLSDFRMPIMNGEQFYAAAIEKHPELARRIVFLTGDTVNDETQFFLKKTGNPHLGKPFQLVSVQQVVSEILAQQTQLAA